MVAVDKTLIAIGEGPSGPRAAYYDGERFYSYELTSPSVLEWAARAGARTLVGSRRSPVHDRRVSAYIDSNAPPPPADADASPVQLRAIRSFVVRRARIALKADLPSTRSRSRPTRPSRRRRSRRRKLPKGTRSSPSCRPRPRGRRSSPRNRPLRLPDGVTTVGGSERGLLVGTRFLGALRIENDVPRVFRINDLAAGAVRLTVACISRQERRRRLLPRHRRHARLPLRRPGLRDRARRSRAGLARARHPARSQGRRAGHPPRRRQPPAALLARRRRALDADRHGDRRGPRRRARAQLRRATPPTATCGSGCATSTRTATRATSAPTRLPSTRARWSRTRSCPPTPSPCTGSRRTRRGSPRAAAPPACSTASCASSPRTTAWRASSCATSDRAPTGRPSSPPSAAPAATTARAGPSRASAPFYPPANALAHDAHGNVFIGTDKGLWCVGECPPDAIDRERGLLDDKVDDLAVDGRNRVWVLTEKGINIVEP